MFSSAAAMGITNSMRRRSAFACAVTASAAGTQAEGNIIGLGCQRAFQLSLASVILGGSHLAVPHNTDTHPSRTADGITCRHMPPARQTPPPSALTPIFGSGSHLQVHHEVLLGGVLENHVIGLHDNIRKHSWAGCLAIGISKMRSPTTCFSTRKVRPSDSQQCRSHQVLKGLRGHDRRHKEGSPWRSKKKQS